MIPKAIDIAHLETEPRLCQGCAMTFDPSLPRAELPCVLEQSYLNAGTFGPTPKRVAEAMRRRIDEVLLQGRTGRAGMMRLFDLTEQARRATAQSFDVSPDTLALMHCTTDGINTVLWGLAWQPGDEVISTTAEHPGLTAPLEALCAARGIVVRYVAPTREAIHAALSPRTKLIAVSHVLWTTGETLPMKEIVQDAHAANVKVLVDGAQSAGAIAVDLGGLGADYYTISGQKWLCGPSGTGALYIHPEALAALSTPWPWYMSKNRFGATPKEWTTAQRLDASTLSITSVAGMTAALAFHREHTQNGALTYAAALAATFRARLRETPGIRVIDVERPSTLVAFTKEGAKAEDVSAMLEGAQVYVRPIPGVGYVRASVGFWNDATDIDRLVAGLR